MAEAPRLRAGAVRVRYLPGDHVRVAFAIARRTGNAVVRNRIRRRLRAAADQAHLPPGAYLISGDEHARDASFASLVEALDRIGREVSR